MRSLFTRRGFLALLLIVAFLFPVTAEAANKFWVGGTGNLDGSDTTHISDTSGGAGGAVYPSSSDTLIFDAASGGGTVTFTAAATFTGITMGAFTGTVNTNGQTVTLSATFSVSGTGTRTLTLGASAISGAWSAGTTTNLTFNADTSVLTVPAGTFGGGGLTYATVVMTATNQIDGTNTFGTWTYNGTAVKTNSVSLSANQTVSGTFTFNGNSSVNRPLLRSTARGTARTITAAAISMSNVDIQDVTAAGASAPWNLSAITGLSGDCGGNSDITFTTPVTNYWIGGTGNVDAVAEWANVSGGSASSGRVPLCQDTARFDANSFSAGSQTVTQNMTRIGSVDWTGVTNTPTWTTSTAASFFGSITLVSGMTLTASTQAYTYEGRGSSTITSGGKTWGKNFIIDAAAGSLILGDAFSNAGGSTATFTLTSGTLDTAGFNFSTYSFVGTGSATRAINMGASVWTLVRGDANPWNVVSGGMTLTAGTSTIRLTGVLDAARSFIGGGLTYHRLENATTGAFALQFTGSNTFGSASTPNGGIYIDASAAARTVEFTAGTTTTVTRMGRLDSTTNTITLGSITAAGHTLARASGSPYKTVIENLSVSRSTVTANAFYAPGGTDGGNNSNWVFTQPPGRGIVVH